MGDRCYLQMTIRKADLPKWDEVFGESLLELCSEHVETGGTILITEEEANYGWYDELSRAAEAGCVFKGESGSGGCYGPVEFVGVDEDIASVNVGFSGGVVVDVDEDGNLAPSSKAMILEFNAATKKANEILIPLEKIDEHHDPVG